MLLDSLKSELSSNRELNASPIQDFSLDLGGSQGLGTDRVYGKLLAVSLVQVPDHAREHTGFDEKQFVRFLEAILVPGKVWPVGALPVPRHERKKSTLSIMIIAYLINRGRFYRSRGKPQQRGFDNSQACAAPELERAATPMPSGLALYVLATLGEAFCSGGVRAPLPLGAAPQRRLSIDYYWNVGAVPGRLVGGHASIQIQPVIV